MPAKCNVYIVMISLAYFLGNIHAYKFCDFKLHTSELLSALKSNNSAH